MDQVPDKLWNDQYIFHQSFSLLVLKRHHHLANKVTIMSFKKPSLSLPYSIGAKTFYHWAQLILALSSEPPQKNVLRIQYKLSRTPTGNLTKLYAI